MPSDDSIHVPEFLPDVKGLANVASNAYSWTYRTMAVLFKPVVLSTNLLLRKGFGERYLSPSAVAGGGLLIMALTELTAYLHHTPGWANMGNALQPTLPVMLVRVVGYGWLVGYVVSAVLAMREIRSRVRDQRLWHSYCVGDWRTRVLTPGRQRLILAGIGALLIFLKLYPLGVLVLWSTYQSMLLDTQLAARIYQAVLDVNDQKIESERLQEALDQKPADDSNGLLLPLPPVLAERAKRAFLRKGDVATPLVEPKIAVPPSSVAAST